jgi:hypothetical protein
MRVTLVMVSVFQRVFCCAGKLLPQFYPRFD